MARPVIGFLLSSFAPLAMAVREVSACVSSPVTEKARSAELCYSSPQREPCEERASPWSPGDVGGCAVETGVYFESLPGSLPCCLSETHASLPIPRGRKRCPSFKDKITEM